MFSRYPFCKWIRIAGALFAVIASVAWVTERIAQHGNKVTTLAEQIAGHWQSVVLALMIAALAVAAMPGTLRWQSVG
jgi:hypothetical protein